MVKFSGQLLEVDAFKKFFLKCLIPIIASVFLSLVLILRREICQFKTIQKKSFIWKTNNKRIEKKYRLQDFQRTIVFLY